MNDSFMLYSDSTAGLALYVVCCSFPEQINDSEKWKMQRKRWWDATSECLPLGNQQRKRKYRHREVLENDERTGVIKRGPEASHIGIRDEGVARHSGP